MLSEGGTIGAARSSVLREGTLRGSGYPRRKDPVLHSYYCQRGGDGMCVALECGVAMRVACLCSSVSEFAGGSNAAWVTAGAGVQGPAAGRRLGG